MVTGNTNPYNYVTTFTDREIQSRGNLLDISPATELGAIHQEVADQSILTSIFNFGQNQVAKATEKKLSVEEVNSLYGTEDGLVKFDTPEYPSVAKRIRTNKIQQAQRAALLQQDAYDNNAGSTASMLAVGLGTGLAMDPFLLIAAATGVGGVAAGSLMSEAAVASKLKNLATMTDTLSKLPGVKTATQVANSVYESTSAAKLGSSVTSGAIRAATPIALEQLATEPFVYANAKQNGYDYDVQQALLFGLVATGAGASIGGFLNKSLLKNQSKKFFSSLPTEQQAAASFDFLETAIKKDVISEEIYSNLISKVTDDLTVGRPFDLDFIKATLRVDSTSRQSRNFVNQLKAGDFDNLFTDAQKQQILNLDYLDQDFIRASNFKKWATFDLNDLPTSTRAFNTFNISNELGLEGASLNQIRVAGNAKNTAINKLSKRLREIEDNLQLIASDPTSNLKKKQFISNKLQIEKQDLLRKLNTEEEEFLKIQSLERRVMSEELGAYFERATKDRVEDIEFKDYKAEILDLKKILKDKKYPNVQNFAKLTDSTREQLARLFYLLDNENVYGTTLQDLLQQTDDLSLLESYQKHLARAQVEEMPFEQAIDTLKKYTADPDIPVQRALDDALANEQKVKQIENFDAELEDLKQALPAEDLAEFEKQAQAINDDILVRENIVSGLIKCATGGKV